MIYFMVREEVIITMDNKWRLCTLEMPEEEGIYEVRLVKVNDLLSSSIETIMEYDGYEWLLKVPMFINEYEVKAWRPRN